MNSKLLFNFFNYDFNSKCRLSFFFFGQKQYVDFLKNVDVEFSRIL